MHVMVAMSVWPHGPQRFTGMFSIRFIQGGFVKTLIIVAAAFITLYASALVNVSFFHSPMYQ